MSTTHVVKKGESIASIAQAYGFADWKTVYDAPANASFRKLRPNPHLIQVGDNITIPDKSEKRQQVSLGANHRFKLVPPASLPVEVSITFVDEAHQNQAVNGLTVEPAQGQATLRAVTTDSAGAILLKEPDITEGTVKLVSVRDKRVTPEINYDRFITPGKEYSTGQSHVFTLRGLRLPFALARSEKRPGLTAVGATAPDMEHGDFTLNRIVAIRNWGWDLKETESRAIDPTQLFVDLRDLMDDYSTGSLEPVALRMVDRFQANTGGEFSDPALAQAIRAHASTGRFEANIRTELKRLLSMNAGDPTRILPRDMQLAGQPHFDEVADNFNGLGITVHDTWAYDVDLTRYVRNGSSYEGSFRVTLYDHYGLDQQDMEPVPSIIPGVFQKPWVRQEGFRAWFLLQHLPALNFRPFITRNDLDYDFRGNV
jgi:hypothetical protein